jgi:ABC-type uncharacterized transport system substrate-binding protein
MRRREFVALLGGAAATWPLAARAQQAKRVRVGFLDFAGENDPTGSDRARAFRQGLERLGWAPMIDYHWSVFNVERAQRAARDTLKLTPDVIVCAGTPATMALKQATSAVPIVFAIVTEPVEPCASWRQFNGLHLPGTGRWSEMARTSHADRTGTQTCRIDVQPSFQPLFSIVFLIH